MYKFQKLSAHLERVAKGIEPVADCEQGICHNFQQTYKQEWFLLESSGLLLEAFRAWEYYSGHERYPVPDPGKCHPRTKFVWTNNLWIKEYGDLRKKLCLHLSEFITEKLMSNELYLRISKII